MTVKYSDQHRERSLESVGERLRRLRTSCGLSQRALAGPTTIDVGYVKTIDDDGLRAICELDPEVLGLRNTGKAISRRGFRALEDTERLRELDLRGFAWNDKGMIPTINALRKRAGLTIRRDE